MIYNTVNRTGHKGTSFLSEGLKTNTSLTSLIISCKHRRKKQENLFVYHIQQTANQSGEIGARALGEALKLNTTLTELNLECEGTDHKIDIIINISSSI